MEQGNTPIYKHTLQLISNNEFDIPSIIFERFAYLKPTPKAYMLKFRPHPPIFREVSATVYNATNAHNLLPEILVVVKAIFSFQAL